MLKEFREFILRGNVVDLAVAVVIGAAFSALVASLVADIFTPLIAAIFGKPDFSALTFTINGSKFSYGNFINALIAFLSVATVIFFFVVKPLNLLHERRKKAEATAGTGGAHQGRSPVTEIRDLLAQGNTPSRPT